MSIRFPKTWKGWKTLFWLAIHRCPRDHARLHFDPWSYGDDRTLYCFKCEGIGMWPGSAMEALRQNYRATEKEYEKYGPDHN